MLLVPLSVTCAAPQLFLENLATSATHAAPQPLVAEVLRPHPPPMDHDREMASRRMEILQRALDKLQQPLPDHDGATANAPTANTANQRAMRAAERDAAKLQTDIGAKIRASLSLRDFLDVTHLRTLSCENSGTESRERGASEPLEQRLQLDCYLQGFR
eukprot:SAG31_NODE_3953_length_3721_cov_3.909994_3_plen_159_part_00